jgi:hypothetical protein
MYFIYPLFNSKVIFNIDRYSTKKNMPKKVLILTGGGDCPGLNAVIRGIAKRARREKDWEIYGSIEAFNGVLKEPQKIIPLRSKTTAGIHVKGGTILKTTNKDNPINFPEKQAGRYYQVCRSLRRTGEKTEGLELRCNYQYRRRWISKDLQRTL